MNSAAGRSLITDLQTLGGTLLSETVFADNSGCYAIVLRVKRQTRIAIGALGPVVFAPGLYVYCGNAARGLRSRVLRHMRATKNKHWHLDYLTCSRQTQAVAGLVFQSGELDECALVRRILSKHSASAPVKGFGSSDCRQGCRAHLLRIEEIVA